MRAPFMNGQAITTHREGIAMTMAMESQTGNGLKSTLLSRSAAQP